MKTLEKVSENLIEQARQANLIELAGQHTELRKKGAAEKTGPCPKCGGDDRFNVQADWFLCRTCHTTKGDPIEFVRWMHGYGFREAVEHITGDTLPSGPVEKRKPEKKRPSTNLDWRSSEWQQQAQRGIDQAHNTLLDSMAGRAGQKYLLGRGIEPNAWMVYRLGFNPSISLPGTKGKEKAPAITIPWIVGDKPRGIRYRLLKEHNGQKQTAFFGSRFSDALYGGQALTGGIRALSTLIICEGELNALSIWQASEGTALDVLSMGSEGARLPDKMIEVADQYRRVIVWMDKEARAKKTSALIEGAWAIQSPNDQDANDLLQQGILSPFLALARTRAAANDYERQALLWDLCDRAALPAGVDTGTAQVINRLANELSLPVALVERGGCWNVDYEHSQARS